MLIQPDAEMTVTEGDFGDVKKDQTLHVAPRVFGVLRSLGARTAESLYDQAAENPQLIADALQWSKDDLAEALADLRSEITKVKPDYFDKELVPPSRFGLGARPPRTGDADNSGG